jgi:hypothetical protein
MRDIARQYVFPAATALICILAPAAPADTREALPLRFIDVIGQVSDPAGLGLAGVEVALEGVRDVSATTDASGSYTLTVPIASLGDPARKAVTKRVSARRPGWGFNLRNGQGELLVEWRMQKGSDPLRCRVRSNVLQSVDAITAALRRGDRNALIANVDFVGSEGGSRSSRASLRSEAITVVGAPADDAPAVAAPAASPAETPKVARAERSRTPAPATPRAVERKQPEAPSRAEVDAPVPSNPPVVAPVPATRAAARPRSVTIRTDSLSANAAARRRTDSPSSRPRIRRIEAQERALVPAPDTAAAGIVRLPGPGVTQSDASLIRRFETTPGGAVGPGDLRSEDVLAGEGECGCRIRGTVEIHPDHLLTRRLDLLVTLRESPAVRDTIQLFMGSPRAFELPVVRCGTWHIEVDAVARREFAIVSADGRGPVDCREGGLHQLRVVLTPR